MTNRFTKTSWFVQGGIMGVPSDGTPKTTVPCNECSKENDVEITIVEQTRDSKNR